MDTGSDFSLNLIFPKGWHELSDSQLRFVYTLVAADFSADEIACIALLAWNKLRVIGKNPDGSFLVQKGKAFFSLSPLRLAELLADFSWLSEIPSFPVRISTFRRAKALPADFQGVSFETFIICDNLYQGYLQTSDNSFLDQLASILYSRKTRPNPALRVSIFYWIASLKQFLANRFPDFFKPASTDSNLLGSPDIGAQLQESMDAQIRALTKGDVTKEPEILALDTWRALTELNAQAREYKEIQSKFKH